MRSNEVLMAGIQNPDALCSGKGYGSNEEAKPTEF
jgi:hypothetical protein